MTNTLALPKHPRFIDFHARSFTAEELGLLAASPSLIRLDFKHCTIGARTVVFYTRDGNGSQERFVLVKKAGRWLLDHKERLGDGWERAFL